MSLASQLKKWDAYGKLANDVKVKTFSGAAISLTAAAIIVILFLAELNHFLKVETHDELVMDAEASSKLPIHFDITFHHLPCSILSIDAMDVSGDHQFDLSHHISKTPLSKTGEIIGGTVKHELLTQKKAEDSKKEEAKCGNCYGAEDHPGQCCNSCDDVRKAYRAKGWALDDLKNIEQCVSSGQTNEAFANDLAAGLGCRAYGLLEVNRVNGNFHFAPGKSFENAAVHVHDLMSFTAASFNISHRINHIRFGDSYPGARHPLDKFNVTVTEPGGMFMYYTKVVPTSYRYSSGKELSTNQYSATTHFRKNQENAPRESHLGLPGVFFFYEMSPVRVIVKETSHGFIHFIARVCAIVGGVFTIAGIIDKFVYHGVRVVEKKLQINKLS